MAIFHNRVGLRGKVTLTVFGPDGEIKRFPQTRFQKAFGLPGRLMRVTNHNIVTEEGDKLIADLMAQTPAKNKVDSTNGHICIGTGFSAESKSASGCLTQVAAEVMDSGYPQQKASWGASVASARTTVYRATFEAGDVSASGIDEAALMNASTVGGDCLAYAQIDPVINMTASDTLQVDWELSFTGA